MTRLVLIFPLVCAFIGLATNWLAIKMLFYPLEEKKYLGLLKWQGVVSKGFPRFAKLLANVIENEFIQIDDITRSIDLKKELQANKDAVYETIASFCEDHKNKLPKELQKIIAEGGLPLLQSVLYEFLLAEAQNILRDFMRYGQDKVGIRNYVLNRILSQGAGTIENILFGAAGREIRFIVWYGGIFGALLGFLQYSLFAAGLSGWLLPAIGAVVGMVTNFLALLMLWVPKHPVQFAGMSLQGAVPARADIIQEGVQAVIAKDFLLLEELCGMMVDALSEAEIRNIVQSQLKKGLPNSSAQAAGVMAMLSAQQALRIGDYLVQAIVNNMPAIKHRLQDYISKELDVFVIMRNKKQVTADEFIAYMEHVMGSEPWVLMAYGGLLGGLIGLVQMLML